MQSINKPDFSSGFISSNVHSLMEPQPPKIRTKNSAKKWQIQVRTTHLTKWKPKGTYETRDAARAKATELRADWSNRNVRVVRKITGGL